MRAFVFLVVSMFVMAGLVVLAQESQKDTVRQFDKRAVRQLVKNAERKVLTTYGTDGRPIYQSQDAKGWHRQFGSITLDSGRAVVTLNTSPSEGKQDISFVADSTYRGVAWSLDSANTNTYWVIPLSGTQVLVKSSDNTDTVTVRFLLEGN